MCLLRVLIDQFLHTIHCGGILFVGNVKIHQLFCGRKIIRGNLNRFLECLAGFRLVALREQNRSNEEGRLRILREQLCHLAVDRQGFVRLSLGKIRRGEQIVRLSYLRPLFDQRNEQIDGGSWVAFPNLELGEEQDCLLEMRSELYRFISRFSAFSTAFRLSTALAVFA